jgi:pimeloyl-ACP methyl ester carboxylesterase
MPKPPVLTASDARALAQLAVLAVTGVTDVAQEAHHGFLQLPGALGRLTHPALTLIPDIVYTSIKGMTQVIGAGVDSILSMVPERTRHSPVSVSREAALAALNGVVGDLLAEKHSPLAISMCFRVQGKEVTVSPSALRQAFPNAKANLLVMVHGSSMNDLQWRWGTHDLGEVLATHTNSTVLWLHYNSGLHISTNGRQLAHLLEQLTKSWPVSVKGLTLVGHSMGGLVMRSACHFAQRHKLHWLSTLRAGAFLGTPHFGAPLERMGRVVDFALGALPTTRAFARLGKIRSAGVGDLALGSLSDEDWQNGRKTRRVWIPLPAGVNWFVAAAVLGKRSLKGKARAAAHLIGDGLVPLASALGLEGAHGENLGVDASNRWVGYQLTHVELLKSRRLASKLKTWLKAQTA